MRRRVHPFRYSRSRVHRLAGTLRRSPPSKWPIHLQRAIGILEPELGLPASVARDLLVRSVEQAFECARALDRRALSLNRYKTTEKVRKSFSRLAACSARAPVALQRSLDKKINAIIPGLIDSEVVEAIIDAAYRIFSASKCEPSRTALRALFVVNWERNTNARYGRLIKGEREIKGACGIRRSHQSGARMTRSKIIGLKTRYSGLEPATHHNCEAAVSSISRDGVAGTAVRVFKSLAKAIENERPAKISSEAHDLIASYVVAVGRLWLQTGLRPSRATRRDDPKYRSRFHRFVEFVLTAVTEPGSNRHRPEVDTIARQLWAKHARLSPELRTKIGKRLSREDSEWLVSEDHVRKGLRTLNLKMGRETP
jgi:hypothetical protein